MTETSNGNWLGIVVLLLPLIAGGTIAALNADSINETTEKIEAWFREKQQFFSGKTGKIYRFALNPLLFLIVKFSNWTDSFDNRGLKNGTRVTITLYLIGIWLLLVYFAISFVIALFLLALGLFIVFKIIDMMSDSDDNEVVTRTTRHSYVNNDQTHHGIREKQFYSGTTFFNEELEGRVDKNGNIYKGSNFFNEDKIGRIDDDGNIYKGTQFYNEEKVGRIDDDGNIHKGSNWFNEEKTGRIDKEGNVYKGTNPLNEEKEGRIK